MLGRAELEKCGHEFHRPVRLRGHHLLLQAGYRPRHPAWLCVGLRHHSGLALGALALQTIPSVMIALSVLLPTRTNQGANIVVAPLFILVAIGNAIGET
jgi:hypothetical protein